MDSNFKEFLNNDETFKKKDDKKTNLFYLFLNLYIFFIYGLIASSFGVALNTLKSIFKISSVEFGIGFSLQALGGCISSIIATYTLDKWNRQIQLSFYLLSLSLIILIFPFSNSIIIFYILNGLTGIFLVTIDCVVNIWIVEINRQKANIYLQILHFFYPFGAFFSPIIFGPFLNKENDIKVENTQNPSLNIISTYISYTSNEDDKFVLWIPYAFCSFMFFIAFLLLIVSYKIKPYKEAGKESNNENQDLNNNTDIEFKSLNEKKEKSKLNSENISRNYYIFFIIIISIFITLEVASENNSINFYPTFLNKSGLHLSEQISGYVSSILTFFIFAGRILSIFLSYKISTEVYLYINFGLIFTGNLIILLFGQTSLTLVYIGIGLTGLGFASTYPLALSFVEERISLTNKVSSIMAFSGSFFLIFSPIVISSLIEKFPQFFVYINSTTIILFILFFTFLHVVEIFRIKKLKSNCT